MMLRIIELRVHYEKIEAIKSVFLDMKDGLSIAILGPNGAGKSTLINTISGLQYPTSGEIWFEGKRIDRLPPQSIFAKGIVQVPEGRRIFQRMSVLENLLMGTSERRGRKEISQSLENAFTYFPVLKGKLNQRGGTLSGGEQQMLAIARALMANPKLLLLDEPSLGLAPLMVAQLFEILNRINLLATTILIAEQNARQALKFANKALILETGAIVLSGMAEEMINNDMVRKTYLGGE